MHLSGFVLIMSIICVILLWSPSCSNCFAPFLLRLANISDGAVSQWPFQLSYKLQGKKSNLRDIGCTLHLKVFVLSNPQLSNKLRRHWSRNSGICFETSRYV